jgi:hypothetical protein
MAARAVKKKQQECRLEFDDLNPHLDPLFASVPVAAEALPKDLAWAMLRFGLCAQHVRPYSIGTLRNAIHEVRPLCQTSERLLSCPPHQFWKTPWCFQPYSNSWAKIVQADAQSWTTCARSWLTQLTVSDRLRMARIALGTLWMTSGTASGTAGHGSCVTCAQFNMRLGRVSTSPSTIRRAVVAIVRLPGKKPARMHSAERGPVASHRLRCRTCSIKDWQRVAAANLYFQVGASVEFCVPLLVWARPTAGTIDSQHALLSALFLN